MQTKISIVRVGQQTESAREAPVTCFSTVRNHVDFAKVSVTTLTTENELIFNAFCKIILRSDKKID